MCLGASVAGALFEQGELFAVALGAGGGEAFVGIGCSGLLLEGQGVCCLLGFCG